MVGASLTHKSGSARPNKPPTGAAGAVVVVSGIVLRNGALVDVAWGTDALNAPASGWVPAGASDANGNWSVATTYPAAGTWWLWARRPMFARVAEAIGPVTVV